MKKTKQPKYEVALYNPLIERMEVKEAFKYTAQVGAAVIVGTMTALITKSVTKGLVAAGIGAAVAEVAQRQIGSAVNDKLKSEVAITKNTINDLLEETKRTGNELFEGFVDEHMAETALYDTLYDARALVSIPLDPYSEDYESIISMIAIAKVQAERPNLMEELSEINKETEAYNTRIDQENTASINEVEKLKTEMAERDPFMQRMKEVRNTYEAALEKMRVELELDDKAHQEMLDREYPIEEGEEEVSDPERDGETEDYLKARKLKEEEMTAEIVKIRDEAINIITLERAEAESKKKDGEPKKVPKPRLKDKRSFKTIEDIYKEEAEALKATINLAKDDVVEAEAFRLSRKAFDTFFIGTINALGSRLDEIGADPRNFFADYETLSTIRNNIKAINEFLQMYVDIATEELETMEKNYRFRNKFRTAVYSPYPELFETYVDRDTLENSEAFNEHLREIVNGVNQDVYEGLGKGAFIVRREYDDTWRFLVANFTKEDAEKLSEYLGITVDKDASSREVEKAYKTYVKTHHSDLSDHEEADIKVSAVSDLMKRYREFNILRESQTKAQLQQVSEAIQNSEKGDDHGSTS